MKRFLHWLSLEIYPSFLPVYPEWGNGAKTYLSDLWSDAPLKVALVQTILALIVLIMPMALLMKPKLFSSLPIHDRSEVIRRMSSSRIYLIRLIAYGVKGHATVAIMRDPLARNGLTKHKHLEQKEKSA